MANAVLAKRPERTAQRTDRQLVSAVRRGDDRAFEQLYARYQRRIAAYVCGMVKDYGRAEDITQEVFVSALRRMRETERPISFKAWIYEIAKNACIDAYRRGRGAEEVSYDADDRLSPSDHVRLVAPGPEPDAAIDVKQDLDHLCRAFGGLSENHHEILVLRELEGLSYRDIGERMGMSRPAVESTLFRARKRLGEEYDELASGARCGRVQGIIADDSARLGLREQRRLARHLSHCQPCRRLAASAGLELPVPVRRRVAKKIAALLPLPGVLRVRRAGGHDEGAGALGGGGNAWMGQLPAFADSIGSGWGKAAAAVAALLLAGAGAGTFSDWGKRDGHGIGLRTPEARSAPGVNALPGPGRASPEAGDRAADRGPARRGPRRSGGSARAGGKRGGELAGNGGVDSPAMRDPASARTPSDPEPLAELPRAVARGVAPVDVPVLAAPDVQDTTDTVADALPELRQAPPEVPVDVSDAGQVTPPATEPATDALQNATGDLLGP